MKMQNTKPAGREGISYGMLPGVPLLAALAAALVYFAASGLGTISRSTLLPSPMGMSPLKVGLVVITSAIGAAVFALIGLFARRPLSCSASSQPWCWCFRSSSPPLCLAFPWR